MCANIWWVPRHECGADTINLFCTNLILSQTYLRQIFIFGRNLIKIFEFVRICFPNLIHFNVHLFLCWALVIDTAVNIYVPALEIRRTKATSTIVIRRIINKIYSFHKLNDADATICEWAYQGVPSNRKTHHPNHIFNYIEAIWLIEMILDIVFP